MLWLIPTLPFAGALLLIVAGSRLSRPAVAWLGAGSVGLSAAITLMVVGNFLASGSVPFSQTLWTWMSVAGFSPGITLHLDALSAVFIFVITFVGFLIHIYSAGFMADDDGYARFFAYLNLFVGSMLILVLADNFVLLYFGWEGVGLCSYLLIGFWYEDPKNGDAARKAFIVTRIGDTAMAIGLFMLFRNFATLNIQDILTMAPEAWTPGSETATAVALLLLGGAVGKSAQLPLQTWLPDAMAGPSPVSALIHAATMVTAGVYLVARTHVLFELSPVAQNLVGVIGALTLLIAGFSALTQSDLKRVLAYSTISQIGYMFLALGVGAWSAGIFHFMIHAFFKALLFLAAGAVILALHHEHDMFRMGGLRRKLPAVYWTFLIGSASLAALPLVTAGFYSKDQILWEAWASEKGGVWFFFAALLGALITAIYTTRMVVLTFFGEERTKVSHGIGRLMTVPLVVLAILSLAGGFVELPHTMGHFTLFSDLLEPVLPGVVLRPEVENMEWIFQLIAALVTIGGVAATYYLYAKKPEWTDRIKESGPAFHAFWYSGWGFDSLYHTVFVRPFLFITRVNKHDVIDKIYEGLVALANLFNRIFSYTQSGMLRWYVMGVVVGTIIILAIGLIL